MWRICVLGAIRWLLATSCTDPARRSPTRRGKGCTDSRSTRISGEFVLTHPAIRCPESGPYYSANLANVPAWPSNARRYIGHFTDSAQAGPAYSLRYAGALVADVHRTVLEGGIYLYPCDKRHPDGKLRLLYECAPLAFVVEQGGWRSIDRLRTGARRADPLGPPTGPPRDREPGRGGALRRVHGERLVILGGDIGGTGDATGRDQGP